MKWRTCPQSMDIFFFLSFSYFIQSRVSLSVAYLTVANLARLGISVHCQVSVRSQYLVRLLSQCWMTGNRTIHLPFEGLSPPTGIEPTPLQNSASKVAGLQVHATTPGSPSWMLLDASGFSFKKSVSSKRFVKSSLDSKSCQSKFSTIQINISFLLLTFPTSFHPTITQKKEKMEILFNESNFSCF